jgi:thioesterase domain-containing protein
LPLLTGARLVMAVDAEIADGRRLLHRLQRSGATIMHAAPQVWAGLVESHWVGYPALKMLCSGVELDSRLATRLTALNGELWAMHGHPETGIWSSTVRLKPNQPAISGSMPIGEPIANTALYVLDSRMQAVAAGATGILHIGGDGIAEAQTPGFPASHAATVVADPLGLMQRTRLFCTGDLVRLRASGTLEYLGRADDQFSYQGRLVDPTAIERLLLLDTRISQAAVVLRGERGGMSASLAAHVVVRPGQAQDLRALVGELRALLARSLTHELLPASILLRAALPQLPNGSIDRSALRTTDAPPAAAETDAPSGPIEQELGKLWASMLGLETVGASDNFFELGGHSLLAARMLARVERVFGRRLKLATLFSAPTVRELARILSRADMREFDFRQLVKIQPYGSKPPLIAINNTGVYYGLAKCLGADQPVFSLQLFDPSASTVALPDNLEGVAASYVELIRHVQPDGPYSLMGWCVAGALAFEIARQLKQSGQEVTHLFLIDSWVPGYFSRQSFLRGLIGEYTLRWQQILAEWRKVLAGKKSLSVFLAERTMVKDLRRVFGRSKTKEAVAAQNSPSSPESYDQWLLEYLQKTTDNYQPRRFPIHIILLRSHEEPTGWLFRDDAGWAAYTSGKVDLGFVDGDHFTMFKNPGVQQMARHIGTILGESRSGNGAASSG